MLTTDSHVGAAPSSAATELLHYSIRVAVVALRSAHRLPEEEESAAEWTPIAPLTASTHAFRSSVRSASNTRLIAADGRVISKENYTTHAQHARDQSGDTDVLVPLCRRYGRAAERYVCPIVALFLRMWVWRKDRT